MLDISRGTFTANYDVKVKHEWNKYKFEGRELRGKTLGVMGFGRIGKRVGELGRAFGMNCRCLRSIPETGRFRERACNWHVRRRDVKGS